MSSLFYRGLYVYVRFKDRPLHYRNVPTGIKARPEEKRRKNGKWVFPKAAWELKKRIDEDIALGLFGFRREVLNKAPRLSEVAEDYYTAQVLKEATVASYRQSVANAVRLMGDLPIIQYRDQDVERFRKALFAEGKARATVAKWLRELGIIFEFARKKRRYIVQNVVEDLKLLTEEGDANPFNADELKKFFRQAWQSDRVVYDQTMFLLLTGCRSSESFALLLADIHPEANELVYRNQKGDRQDSVPMTDVLRDFLKRIPDIHASHAFHYRSINGLNTVLKRVLKASGVTREGLTVHSLKKTLGTLAADSGVELDVAAMLLHHTDRAVTVDNYLKKAAVKKKKRAGLTIAHQELMRQIVGKEAGSSGEGDQ